MSSSFAELDRIISRLGPPLCIVPSERGAAPLALSPEYFHKEIDAGFLGFTRR